MNNSEHKADFTAREIAQAVRISKRAVLKVLDSIPPTGTRFIGGQQTNAWSLEKIPSQWIQIITQSALQGGFTNAEGYLRSTCKDWSPQVPLCQMRESDVGRASKLQKALLPILERAESSLLTDSELETLGLQEYKRVFGHNISARHWKRIYQRTVLRDGGRKNWSNLEIFTEERATRKNNIPWDQIPTAQVLQDLISTFANPLKPNTIEKGDLWAAAFWLYEDLCSSGVGENKAKRKILEVLRKQAFFLARSNDSMRKLFSLKYQVWKNSGRSALALADKRHENSGRWRSPDLPQSLMDDLVARGVLVAGGRLSQAWRALKKDGALPGEILEHYKCNRKSYVPLKIRERVTPELRLLADMHHGPRQARLNGPHILRDVSGVFAGDWYQSDDLTAPVYFWFNDEDGKPQLTRGQFLPMIDWRSTCILTFVLIPHPNYNSRHIRGLMNRTATRYGFPRRGYVYEMGIWKRAKLVQGVSNVPLEETRTEFKRKLGIEIKHVLLPRAKPVERVLGALQNLMEGEPGYCGRDERNDKYERVQRQILECKSGRRHPAEFFLSFEQWESRLNEICTDYNSEAQEGKYTEGLSPLEAFKAFQNPDEPQVSLRGDLRYLFASFRTERPVTAKGITISIGNQKFTYRDENSGKLIGQRVVAWFDSEDPEILTVTDLNNQNPVCVAMAKNIPAFDATPEEISAEVKKINGHLAYAKERYRDLVQNYQPKFRFNLVNPDVRELGREMAAQRKEAIARQAQAAKARRQAHDVYGRTPIVMPENVTRESLEAAENFSVLYERMKKQAEKENNE